ncbi:peptidoglycan DD-metalloendopeptidase family protein [Kushneria sp. AK178]
MIRFYPRMRQVTLGSSVVLMAVLGGCAQLDNAPAVEEASFNQSSMASGIYHVQRGDTIYSIGWKTGIDFRRLASLNNLEPPYNIEPGQALRLNDNVSAPSGPSSSVASSGTSGTRATALSGAPGSDSGGGDDSWLSPDEDTIDRNRTTGAGAQGTSREQVSQSAIGAATGVGAAAGSAADGSANSTGGGQDAGSSQSPAPSQGSDAASTGSADSGTQADTGGTAVAGKTTSEDRSDRTYTPTTNIDWQWPTEGSVVGSFGDETNLTAGIDIAGQKGQPVKAAGPGIVVYAGDGVRGYGNLIILKHNDHFLSAYAHNDALNVRENDVVRQGETIATMGSTDADSVKLHFEIRQDGQPKDPMQYLPDR